MFKKFQAGYQLIEKLLCNTKSKQPPPEVVALRYPHGGIFKIATQNSNYFKEFLVEHHISPKGDDSIYVVHHNQVLKKSKAIKKILANCDAKGKFFSMMLALIPSRLADFGYDLFAKHRKKFYPNDVCSLPDKNFQARII